MVWCATGYFYPDAMARLERVGDMAEVDVGALINKHW
jgi:hypothetical protein